MIKFSFFAVDFIEGYFFGDGFSFAVLDAVIVDSCEVFVIVFGMHTESSFEMIHHLIVCLQIRNKMSIVVRQDDVIGMIVCGVLVVCVAISAIIADFFFSAIIDMYVVCGEWFFLLDDENTGIDCRALK